MRLSRPIVVLVSARAPARSTRQRLPRPSRVTAKLRTAAAPPTLPVHGLRSDWFDPYAEKRSTRMDVPAVIDHDEDTSPAPGVRGVLYPARFSGTIDVPDARLRGARGGVAVAGRPAVRSRFPA